MRIYATPGTGKTTLCCSDHELIDGDNLLFYILEQKFPNIVSKSGFAQSIIRCFERDRAKAEQCYSRYKDVLLNCRDWQIILYGTRRFMWCADILLLEWDWTVLKKRGRSEAKEMVQKEVESFNRWDMAKKPCYYLKGSPITNDLISNIKYLQINGKLATNR